MKMKDPLSAVGGRVMGTVILDRNLSLFSCMKFMHTHDPAFPLMGPQLGNSSHRSREKGV